MAVNKRVLVIVIENREMSAQNHILISSSLTALGKRTPDSVMMPEIRFGGCMTLVGVYRDFGLSDLR